MGNGRNAGTSCSFQLMRIDGKNIRESTKFMVMLASALFAGSFSGIGFSVVDGLQPGQRLSIETSYQMLVTELSGLALVLEDAPEIDFLAVGDSDYQIARFSRTLSSGTPNIRALDASSLVDGKTHEFSQWEAIALDGLGNVCLLAEVTAQVRCLDKDLSKQVASFQLDPTTLHNLNKSWQAEPNSRGEGMILLRQGHVLLLKEKKPSLLVEFGPENEGAIGYSSETFLKPGKAFTFPAKGRLVALKVWEFAESLSKLAKDGSDITLGPDGRVYLLSDESALLIRLEGKLKPEEVKVRESAYWKLPKEIVKPEGLAIDQELRPWVVVDQKRENRPSLFRLSPITAP
ncbi:MAG: SdiA-regulated domain-containing protein [Methylobacter sp.]|nr:SdiA-regulated domain-containing protein [Methylobacter sp.]